VGATIAPIPTYHMNISKMESCNFLIIAHISFFSPDTYWWTYIHCKELPEGCFKMVDARFKVCVLLGFLQKHG